MTWLKIRVECSPPAEDEDVPIGAARAALIHVGTVADTKEDLYEVLDADSGELEALHGIYFESGWFREEFSDGLGTDLLYVEDLTLDPAWQGRNIEFAVVRRLCDTLGCAARLAVTRYESREEASHWTRMGFEITTPDRDSGYMHLTLSYPRPRIVEADGEGGVRFRVLPNPSGQAHH